MVRLLALQDHREVGVTGPLDDERVVAVCDRAEGLPAEDREGSAHEILDHIEGGPEQILIDGRLPLPRFGADQRPVLEGEERGLDRIPAGLESADSLRDALATPGIQGVNRGCRHDEEERRERRRDLGAQRTEDAVRPQSEEDNQGEHDQETARPPSELGAHIADDLVETIDVHDPAEAVRPDVRQDDEEDRLVEDRDPQTARELVDAFEPDEPEEDQDGDRQNPEGPVDPPHAINVHEGEEEQEQRGDDRAREAHAASEGREVGVPRREEEKVPGRVEAREDAGEEEERLRPGVNSVAVDLQCGEDEPGQRRGEGEDAQQIVDVHWFTDAGGGSETVSGVPSKWNRPYINRGS